MLTLYTLGPYFGLPDGSPFVCEASVADSTLIRWHIETKYGFDFDSGLDTRQKAVPRSLRPQPRSAMPPPTTML